jgi:hypothetical protein
MLNLNCLDEQAFEIDNLNLQNKQMCLTLQFWQPTGKAKLAKCAQHSSSRLTLLVCGTVDPSLRLVLPNRCNHCLSSDS